MFENKNNKEVIPAMLSNGEALIPTEQVEDWVAINMLINEQENLSPEVLESPEEVPEDTQVLDAPEPDTSKEEKPLPKKKKEDKVAVYSTRNVTWTGVGKVYTGYNIVTPEAAEKWLERNHIRMATPEQVAKEFGK